MSAMVRLTGVARVRELVLTVSVWIRLTNVLTARVVAMLPDLLLDVQSNRCTVALSWLPVVWFLVPPCNVAPR